MINGGGFIDREYGVGSGRIDLCIRWPHPGGLQRWALELKVWRDGRPDPAKEGLPQLAGYLARLGLDDGTLILFDGRTSTPPLPERCTESEIEHEGRRIRVVLVPKPFAPEQLEAVSIKDFSPRRKTTLRSVSSSPYYAKLPMPALLGPFFGNEPELEVMYAEGALAVDLTGDAPVYRYEGGLRLLRNNIGRGVVEYVPGQYASVAITEALIPSALPQVCIKMNQALAELDFTRKSLRVAGSMEIESVDSFLCPRTSIGQEMGFFTRAGLGFALGAARDGLGLPSRITSRGHFLFDLDDGIVCGDVAVNGYSLFHAAYLGNANTFQMWAPRGFMADDIRPGRPLGSFWDLGVGAFTADWAFPASNPRQCWDEDPGPRIDLERSILTDWRPETAGLESSELY